LITEKGGVNHGVQSIHDIVRGIQNDLKNLKTQMENIPPFPKG
jgi:archaellum component FlaC